MESKTLLALLLHELSQPIGAASLSAQLLIRDVRRLVRTVDGLRVLQVALSGDREALPQRKRRTLAKALRVAAPASLTVHMEFPAELALHTCPGAVEVFLSNLLRNAQRYARGADVTVSARLLAAEERPWPPDEPVEIEGPRVLLRVSDQGPGIPAELRARLFSMGAKGTAHRGGSGLGLFIAQQLVYAHGGALWLEPTPSGTSFASIWPGCLDTPDGWPVPAEAFGRAIHTARKKARLTRLELAQQAGISDATLRNVETARHQVTQRIRDALVRTLAGRSR